MIDTINRDIIRRVVLPAIAAAVSLLAWGTVASARLPDYILLKRCAATMDERVPQWGYAWQLGIPLVSIQLSDGRGGWTARHSFEFDTFAFCNGPNGFAEYGSGDDLCLGRAADLPGTLVYSAPTEAPDALSGSFSLTDSPLTDYGPGLNTTAAINASFDLTGYLQAYFIYFHHHALLWDSNADVCRVEVSTNAGSSWTTVREHRYYPGDKGQFKRAEANLSSYAVANQTIQIRLRFSSGVLSTGDDGWFLDDVRLLAFQEGPKGPPPVGTTLFFDDFESGTTNWTLGGTWGLSFGGYLFSDLGDIDANGVYMTTPVDNPVLVGEGMGFGVVRAAYTEESTTWVAHAQVHHMAPQYAAPPELGYDDDVSCPFRTCTEGVAVDQGVAPARALVLEQNRPNPFHPSTDLGFTLPEGSPVSLRIYDEAGRLVRILLDGEVFPAGEHGLSWNGRDAGGQPVRAGVYFYELRVNGQEHTRRMVLLK